AHDAFEIGEQMLVGHAAVDQLGDHRRTPEATADPHFPADVARAVHSGLKADIVKADGGAVSGGAGDGDLEFAREVREFRMQARPLAEDFGDGTWIDDLVGGSTRELV